jgi:hypothetical protein
MNKLFVFICAFVIVSACSTQQAPIEITTKPLTRLELVLPEIQPISIRPIEWVIITPDNVDEIFAKLLESGEDPVLVSLTVAGYESISMNYSDAISLIRQQKSVISAYKQYYVKVNQ